MILYIVLDSCCDVLFVTYGNTESFILFGISLNIFLKLFLIIMFELTEIYFCWQLRSGLAKTKTYKLSFLFILFMFLCL